LESETLNRMHRRIVQNFLDVIILMELKRHQLSGYDVISLVHNKFHILLSSGGIYSCLYTLEREGLIKGKYDSKKRVYALTERGKETAMLLSKAKDKISRLVFNLFSGE